MRSKRRCQRWGCYPLRLRLRLTLILPSLPVGLAASVRQDAVQVLLELVLAGQVRLRARVLTVQQERGGLEQPQLLG